MIKPMVLPDRLHSCAHPLVFETGIDDAPYSIFGTCFLAGFRGHTFVVATRHSMQPDANFPVCVGSPSGRLLPLKHLFSVPIEKVPEDYADLVVLDVDIANLTHDMGEASLLPLDNAEDWHDFRETSRFFVFGFPLEHSLVDYEKNEIVEGFVEMEGRFRRDSSSPFLSEIEILDPPPLRSYSGFSGSPVMLLKQTIGAPAVPILCGIAVQGSAESKIIRFID